MALDETLYTSFETSAAPASHACDKSKKRCRQGHRRQYVSIIGAKKKVRVTLPLGSISRVSGNIRVVLDECEDRAYIHVPCGMFRLAEAAGDVVAIDWGVSEVSTDFSGQKHGEGLGKILRGLHRAEQRHRQGQRQAPRSWEGKSWIKACKAHRQEQPRNEEAEGEARALSGICAYARRPRRKRGRLW